MLKVKLFLDLNKLFMEDMNVYFASVSLNTHKYMNESCWELSLNWKHMVDWNFIPLLKYVLNLDYC